ncbi:MAG: D-sedoheptulose 7-phosphate isomerase [Candidatus Azotimanducaceae bacterium]|jgi:D-sedoheptulose 7-phosphate isomerase
MYAQTYMTNFHAVSNALDLESFQNGMDVVKAAWERGSNIITLGNGGSSMTALHFNTDWTKMIYLATGKPFHGRSLVDNMGLIMAYANDVSFADVFSEQLKNVMREGDLVLAISGSGNSENVIRAIDYANDNGGITLGLAGFGGGRLKEKSQHSVWVDSHDMQLVEDCHSMFGHMTMQYLTQK